MRDALRNTINAEFAVPETIAELVTHYRSHELTEDKKAYATVEANMHYLTSHIVPKWGALYLSDIRTVDVELWLHNLQYAAGTRSKICNIMSAVFNHAIRHEWMDRNPITKVRVSAKRLREPDVLSPAELALIAVLNLRERAMVMLAGSTGLRRSELVALTWADIDLELMQVNVRRSCVRNHFGDTKTEASRKPVPLHPSVVKVLGIWREDSPFGRRRLPLSVGPAQGKTAVVTGHVAQEGHSSCSQQSGDRRQGDRLAQLTSLSGDQSSGCWCGPQNGAGTSASCELTDHARRVHASDLRDQAQGQQQSDGDGLRGGRKALSAPSSAPSKEVHDFATCHKNLCFPGFYGGDDGARTRDLCRDRAAL